LAGVKKPARKLDQFLLASSISAITKEKKQKRFRVRNDTTKENTSKAKRQQPVSIVSPITNKPETILHTQPASNFRKRNQDFRSCPTEK
jgi:hypothetical protein